jgi:predicted cupin superfamily sugar epimerase
MTETRPTYTPLDDLIERLELEPHPEGGYFRETWRASRELSGEALDGYPGSRRAGTSILFLIPADESSSLHRIRGEELWLYQYGDPVRLNRRETRDASPRSTVLGPEPDQHFQAAVPAGDWQSAEPLDGPAGYGLVACVSVPGFEFDDFELAPPDRTET